MLQLLQQLVDEGDYLTISGFMVQCLKHGSMFCSTS